MNVFKNSLLVALLACAVLFSGCGKDDEEMENTPPAAAANQKIVFGDGFYGEEKGPNDVVWRWMGDVGSVKLKNFKKDSTLQFRVEAPTRQLTGAPSIMVTLNGQKVDQFTATVGKMDKVYNVTAAQLGTGDFVELKIATDKFFVPKDINKDSADPRKLGLQVDNFTWAEK